MHTDHTEFLTDHKNTAKEEVSAFEIIQWGCAVWKF